MILNEKQFVDTAAVWLLTQADIAVIGLSGGADSTLVAALCCAAYGASNVHGVHLPCTDTDIQKFNARSVRLANHLGLPQHTFNIGATVKGILEPLPYPSELTDGNTRARVRMTTLYALASCLGEEHAGKRVRVMNTCNLSEDLLGYCSKGGDALGDVAPIARLYKSEIYQLLNYLRDTGFILEEHIDREPSAGLWAGQTDAKELGYTYDELEPAMRAIAPCRHFQEMYTPYPSDDVLQAFVAKKWKANTHKFIPAPCLDVNGLVD